MDRSFYPINDFDSRNEGRRVLSDESDCESKFSNIEITNINVAALKQGDHPRELVLPAGAGTFQVSFIIDNRPNVTEFPLTEDLVIKFDSNRKLTELSGSFDLLFGPILLNVDIGNTPRVDDPTR